MNITRAVGVTALIVAGVAPRPGVAQDVAVGTRVRITTRLGFHLQGRLTALDSAGFTVLPDDSTPSARVSRSEVKKFERSLGAQMENYVLPWGEVANWAATGAGVWYGARHHGVGGAVVDGLGAGLGSALLLWPFVVRERRLEEWERVRVGPEVRPVITSGTAGRLLLGVSVSVR